MKTMFSLLTIAVFVLAFGSAFAGDIEPGAYYGGVLTDREIEMLGVKGEAPGGVREAEIDTSAKVFESLFGSADGESYLKHETGVKGAAPGGVREAEIDTSAKVFESLFGSK